MSNRRTEEIIIRCRNLCKEYSKGKHKIPALKNITLDIAQGEMVAAFGPSGSGKTTLLNIIGQLDRPCSGELHIFGKDSQAMCIREQARLRRKKLGFIFQNFNLLPVLSAVENVEMALVTQSLGKRKLRDRALEMLSRVGLESRADHLPAELSGGQQQRVGIARALVHKPRLVMADEPTANLDSASAREIIGMMQKLSREDRVSFLFSTHDSRILSAVDRNIHLTDGEIKT